MNYKKILWPATGKKIKAQKINQLENNVSQNMSNDKIFWKWYHAGMLIALIHFFSIILLFIQIEKCHEACLPLGLMYMVVAFPGSITDFIPLIFVLNFVFYFFVGSIIGLLFKKFIIFFANAFKLDR